MGKYELRVNKSYSKTFSKHALIPRYVLETFSKRLTVLDYGAGKDAFGTILLRNNGFKCTAYDIGDNVLDIHSRDALLDSYDIIMASNVMNVQSDELEMASIFVDVVDSLNTDGIFICNYPKKPRYSQVSEQSFIKLLKEWFVTVDIVSVHNNKIYICKR